MTTTEKISLLVSLFSLLISVLTALKSYLLSEYQLRLNTRNELQKMLIEVNKCMINDPELWATYDDHEVSASIKQSPTTVAKIEAISYMMLNTFEAAFAFYEDSPRLRKAELESYETWKGYFHEYIKASSMARQIIAKAKIHNTFHHAVIDEFDLVTNGLLRLHKKSNGIANK